MGWQLAAGRAVQVTSKKWRVVLLGIGVLVGITAVVLLTRPSPPETITPDPYNAELTAQGEALYAIHCAVCHGEDRQGEAGWAATVDVAVVPLKAPPHDASGHTWHHGDVYLIEAIRLGGARLEGLDEGVSDMPAFGEVLSDEEITAVLSYIKSEWSPDMLTIQESMCETLPE